MTCLHPKSQVMESRRVGAEIYRRRTCGHCLQVFVTVETAPDGLKMPSQANGSIREKQRRSLPKPTEGGITSGFSGWTRSA